jgi:endoglucanase
VTTNAKEWDIRPEFYGQVIALEAHPHAFIMIRFSACILLAGLLLAQSPSAQGQSLAQQRCNAMEKGLNVSNWLEEYWNVDWPVPYKYTKQHFEAMQLAGITSVRLPVNFHAVIDQQAPYAVDESHEVFHWVDSVILWTDQLGMKLIIDNHHGWELSESNWRAKLPMFSHLWSVLAQRYAVLDPERVYFELLNEPSLGFQDSLKVMYNDAIDSIRQHTVQHSIIVSPHWAGSAMVFSDWQPMADTNLIYTWHIYDPLDFSHQGLSWNTPFFPAGNTFPHAEPTFMEGIFETGWQRVLDWKATHDLPLLMGEFGLSNYCDSASVCHWLEYTMTRLKQHDIPWYYWDWQWDFSMYRSNVISADSIYPCFKYYLGLYGDETFTDVPTVASTPAPSLLLYPNPLHAATSALTVEWKGPAQGTLTIYDTMGRMMQQAAMTSERTIVVTTLPKGIYLVELTDGPHRLRQKLVVN